MNEGKVVSRKPVLTRRHTTLFDPVEEPFDLVASEVWPDAMLPGRFRLGAYGIEADIS